MKCRNCHQDILQKNPEMCPYCKSKNLISDDELARIEREQTLEEDKKTEKAGRKTNYANSANINIAKISSISLKCPHCGTSQILTSKSNEVICVHCKKRYIIPKKVLDLL
jgi:Zn finger protein HypA/HybF involved in hydrogenase expression